MSQDNVDLVERALRESQDDPFAFLDIVDADLEWDVRGLDIPDGVGIWRGHAGVKEFFRRWVGAFEEWGYEPVEIRDAGDSVLVQIHQWGRGKGSGVPIEDAFWQAWTVRGEKIVRVAHYATRAEAFEALGLDAD